MADGAHCAQAPRLSYEIICQPVGAINPPGLTLGPLRSAPMVSCLLGFQPSPPSLKSLRPKFSIKEEE